MFLCQWSPGPDAHRSVRKSQADACPVANWSNLTRENLSGSIGASRVRELRAQRHPSELIFVNDQR